jgi:hypothetical protein
VDTNPLRSPRSIGWFPDPLRRFEYRYFNGERWTSDVSSAGARYIDPRPFTPPVDGRVPAPVAADTRHPSRTLAVLSFVLGLAGVALAWAPFVFVVGGAGSIAAIALGIASLRRTTRLVASDAPFDHGSSGRRLAIAGVALGPPGLCLCVVGAILTGVAYREFEEYVDPGEHRIDERDCTLDGTLGTYSGSIVNLGDEPRSYELLVQFLDRSDVVETKRVAVDEVAPGEAGEWTTSARVGDIALRCRVRSVMGPYPFGLDRDR